MGGLLVSSVGRWLVAGAGEEEDVCACDFQKTGQPCDFGADPARPVYIRPGGADLSRERTKSRKRDGFLVRRRCPCRRRPMASPRTLSQERTHARPDVCAGQLRADICGRAEGVFGCLANS